MGEDTSDAEVRVLNVMGGEIVRAVYRIKPGARRHGRWNSMASLTSDGILRITDSQYEEPVEALHVGERCF